MWAKGEATLKSGNVFRAFHQWLLHSEGSTRSAALIRIGLVLLLWSRYAGELLFYREMSFSGILLSANFYLATLMMFLGWKTRFATWYTALVVFAMYYYFGLYLGWEPWTHHHNYALAMGVFLIALTPSGRSFSWDRFRMVQRFANRGEEAPREWGNLWGLKLIVIQLSLIYFFSAWDKSNLVFLSGVRMEHYFMWYYWGSDAPPWPGFALLMQVLAWMTVLLEYALAFGLPFRRTRKYLLLPGIALHLLFFVLLPVRTYSLTMVLLYLAYADPATIHRLTQTLFGNESARDEARPQSP